MFSILPRQKARIRNYPWKGPGIALAKITLYVYKVRLQRTVFNTNHDSLRLCRDRKIPSWLSMCKEKLLQVENGLIKKSNTPQHCVCRGPDTGEMMVQCDNCKEWVHMSCITMIQVVSN